MESDDDVDECLDDMSFADEQILIEALSDLGDMPRLCPKTEDFVRRGYRHLRVCMRLVDHKGDCAWNVLYLKTPVGENRS